jgi:peptide/nickel transport system permease protein
VSAAPVATATPRGSLRRPPAWLVALLKQLGAALVTLVAISVVTFGAVNIRSPESVAQDALGRGVTEGAIQAFIRERGLDQPITERYWDWISGFATGDMGSSVVTERPVADEVVPRFGRTVLLIGLALAIALPLALAISLYMARRTGRVDEAVAVVATIVAASIPDFVIGILLVLGFAVAWPILPVSSSGLALGTPSEQILAFVLPTATLVIVVTPYLIRIGRVAIRDALESDYVRAAVLRGTRNRSVIWRHAMPSAALPLVSATAVSLVWLLGGTIVVENLFGFPGLGQLLVEAIQTGDAPTVQAAAALVGAVFLAASVAADAIAVLLNPKLRTHR